MIAAHATDGHVEYDSGAGDYLKAMVFGALDGIVTTFSVVSGVSGAEYDSDVVLVLGMANLLADGLSMGVGEWVSGKAAIDFMRAERDREEWELENAPDVERQEMIDLYVARGISPHDARTVVDILFSDKDVATNVMMREELGYNLDDEHRSPFRQGLIMYLAFVVAGSVPLLSFAISRAFFASSATRATNFAISCALTAITLFALGAIKQRIALMGNALSMLKGGCIMLGNGGLSAAVAYGVGAGLTALFAVH